MTRYASSDPNDLDPAAGRGTDATADALDALLNRIAHGMGPTAPRTGRDSAGPHAQPDTTPAVDGDLLDGARAFHRRFAAAEARSPGAVDPPPHLWEQIMQQTPSPALAGTRSQSRGRFLPARSRQAPFTVRRERPRLVTHTFQAFANATIAVLLILTALGGWRAYDNFRDSGSPPPATSVPGLAMLPGTPEPAGDDAIAPVTTPPPAYACDFSRDIPIFQQVDTSPIDDTALVLTTSGDLVLTCPEEPESIVLASDVTAGQVGPAGFPGLVSIFTLDVDPTRSFITFVSIFSGTSVRAGLSQEGMRVPGIPDEESPWLVANSYDNPGIWEITDLRTMETRIMDDFVEHDVPLGGVIVPGSTPIITDASGDTLVVGIATRNDIDGDGALFTVEGLPGTLLVLDGSFENSHWIDVPDDLGATRGVVLSPDGEFLALRSSVDERSPASPVNYAIVNTSNGAELGRSDSIEFVDSVSEVRWVQDGRAIAYTDNESLMLLAAEEGAEPVTVFQSDALLTELGNTYDPDVVLVTRMQAEEVATETPELVQPLMYSVNTRTGESIEIEGVDVSHNISPWLANTRFLVMGDTTIQSMDTETAFFRVVDAVTGETIEEIAGIEIAQDPNGPSMGLRAVVSTLDGSVEVIGFNPSQIVIMEAGPDGATVRQLPSPRSEVEAYVGSVVLWLSDDGTRLSLSIDGDETGTRYLIDLTDPEAEWLPVPVQSGSVQPGYGPANIGFVPGTGD